MIFKPSNRLRGELEVPGDKSISHRSIMFGALAQGRTEIEHFLEGADCLSTIACFQQMGIPIEYNHNDSTQRVVVHGKGLHGLSKPSQTLNVGNSGTTIRLMSGILAGQSFSTVVTGDDSIQKRPMNRIITPLTQMGADIESKTLNGLAPLTINPSLNKLHGIHYHSLVASAQVKTSILLAGLYADAKTTVTEPYVSRNHSELMLSSFGATVHTKDTSATIEPEPTLIGQHIIVPGDISSAAYFIVAALIIPGSEIVIKNIGINPTRDGILRICKAMGANISLENIRTTSNELVCDLVVSHSALNGVTIEGSIIPTLIDEIPILAVLSCFANGTTIIKDAAELKVKESNRIDIVVSNLAAMGADIVATEDGMIIHGSNPLHATTIDSKNDHRIAMSFAIAGLVSKGHMNILHSDCVQISYPHFFDDLKQLQREV